VRGRRAPKSFYVPVRMSEVEYRMLDKLMEYWSHCSRSEAVRRCIVYTYIKFLKGEEITVGVLEREYMKLTGHRYE
jgi:hypothetical protein